jgi:excisionase family DNA binding protein
MTLLTTTQAAQQLGIRPTSVRKLVERGKLRASRFGASLMFTSAAVERAKGRPGIGRPKADNRRTK